MALNSEQALAFHLRMALEQWTGDTLSGPWDGIITLLSRALDDGRLSLETAARLDFLLRRTTGDNDPTECEVCDCPLPGLAHAPFGGCPDLRLHDRSDDGLCRYCREP
jgi:hypothetical protein